MESKQTGSSNGRRAPLPGRSGDGRELEATRATCRRQADVIDTLRAAVSILHRGATALQAENTELRAANGRLWAQQPDRVAIGETHEVVLPLDARAPGAARIVVAACLRTRVAPSVLSSGELLISELVTNSVRHSGAPADEQLTVRIQLERTRCRLEVEDPGHDGVIAPRPADPVNGGGIGLNLLQILSERWGLERGREGRTRVWAQLSCAPAGADTHRGANGGPPSTAPTAS